jgi:hypothetical protein
MRNLNKNQNKIQIIKTITKHIKITIKTKAMLIKISNQIKSKEMKIKKINQTKLTKINENTK